MELKQKGSEAFIPLKQLMVTMKWTTAADFDLAAAYEGKDGRQGMVYFGDLGDMNGFPFMQLSGDEGVGDKGGDNEETMRITRLDDTKFVWLFCWDYGMVQSGQSARFADSDVNLTIVDDAGKSVSVRLDTGDTGNVCCLATIDNSSPMGAKLINTSRAGTLKGLKTMDQLLNIAKG
jgi:tellurite resistance protein TerA